MIYRRRWDKEELADYLKNTGFLEEYETISEWWLEDGFLYFEVEKLLTFPEQRYWSCGICKKTFSSWGELNRHACKMHDAEATSPNAAQARE